MSDYIQISAANNRIKSDYRFCDILVPQELRIAAYVV